ncbi:MAG: hypothetical protein JWQ59_1458 [Cryobacterium sp.]|nr:hypothetical protein [Cryobacterium sp.]
MSDECIHGLDNGLCASCFPKAVSEVAVASPRVARAPVSRAREASSPTTLRTARVATTTTPVRPATVKSSGAPVGEQRIYHVTHINNFAGILNSGCLLADASDGGSARPAVDISSAENREARRTALVSGPGSRSVASYVPFFLSPDAALWNSIRSHDADPRLSPEANGSAAFDFIVLVSTVAKAGDGPADTDAEPTEPTFAVADGDAAAEHTRFAPTRETGERMLRTLRADQESEAIREAEFLVGGDFPFDQVTLIGVANDKVRAAVKSILAASAYRPKVAVYPPWFQPSEA